MPALASWSGGKDSCLAYYRAVSQGIQVSCLLNFVDDNGQRSMSHGLDSRLMLIQAQALGVPLIQKRVNWDTYEQGFKEVVRELKQGGVDTGVFGDIDLQEHRDWVERVCSELSIKPVLPLWGEDPEQLLGDFIDAGFEAVVVSVKAGLLSKDWLGRRVDRSFIEYLNIVERASQIHLCGEKGEYHTFVIDGPIFRESIEIEESNPLLVDGYWFLNISRYRAEQKYPKLDIEFFKNNIL